VIIGECDCRSFFSTNDWSEIIESFAVDVKLNESDLPCVVQYFFDEVEKVARLHLSDHWLM